MARFSWIPPALFAVSIVLFLITGSVAWAFNNSGMYQRGFDKYRVAFASGITPADLRQVAADIRGYFNSTEEPLLVRTQVRGEEREIFSRREVLHMKDVKRLVWWVYGIAAASGFYILAVMAWGTVFRGRRFFPKLALWGLQGAGLTVAIVVVFGLLAVAGFDTLFLKFHQLSFSNDFWLLDPRRDYLVILFPQGFWFDAAIWVTLRTLAGGLALAAASGAYLLYRRWASGRADDLPSPGTT